MKDLVAKLSASDRFVDAATHICDASREAGVYQCAIMLHATSGPPVLAVDNFPHISDDHRLYSVSERHWPVTRDRAALDSCAP